MLVNNIIHYNIVTISKNTYYLEVTKIRMNKMRVTWLHLTWPSHILQSMIYQPNLNMNYLNNEYYFYSISVRSLVYDFPDNFYITKPDTLPKIHRNDRKMVRASNKRFWHLEGILNLGWYLKSRSPVPYRRADLSRTK